MLERMLVPLDGSPLAESSVDHALSLSESFGSEVHLLTVIEPQGLDGAADSAEWRMARAEARGYLDRMAQRFRKRDLDVETHVQEGRASDRALDLIQQLAVDLVLLSRHARGGVTEFPMSGTAFKIVSGARCSIFLHRAEEPWERHQGYSRILAPVDCSRRSDWSAHLAANIARGTGAELVVAAVVPTPDLLGDAVDWSGQEEVARQLVALNRKTAEQRLRTLGDHLASEGLRVRTRVAQDLQIDLALRRLAEEEDASLIVVSAHGQSGSPGHSYGSVTSRLLDGAARPLLVFQDVTAARADRPSHSWRPRRRSRPYA